MDRKINMNITFECNSNCRFCAANHEIVGQTGRITFDEIKAICQKWNFGEGDEVILSGGEPTIHPDFWNIVDLLHGRGCRICVLTNGRQLKNVGFLNKIAESKIRRLCVPIHGPEEIHDSITRVNGSFAQTVEGIKCLNKVKGDTRLELKFVICEMNYLKIEEIVDQIAELNPDSVMMSALFQTDVAVKNDEIIGAKEILQAVNRAMNRLKEDSFRGDIAIYGVPLCLLEESILTRLLEKEQSDYRAESEYEELYFDYTRKEGVVYRHSPNICPVKRCTLHGVCTSGDDMNFSMFKNEIRPFISR